VIVLSDEELKHLWSHYDDNKNNLLDLHELHLLVADLVVQCNIQDASTCRCS